MFEVIVPMCFVVIDHTICSIDLFLFTICIFPHLLTWGAATSKASGIQEVKLLSSHELLSSDFHLLVAYLSLFILGQSM